MENFLNTYKPKKEKCKTKEIEDNPLLNFKFDKQRLFAVFNKN